MNIWNVKVIKLKYSKFKIWIFSFVIAIRN